MILPVFVLVMVGMCVEGRHIKFTKPIVTNDTKVIDTELNEKLQWVAPMTGYYENVYYQQTDCTQPKEKHVVAINQCAPTWMYTNGYANLSVNADPDANTYYTTINYYSDSQCTQNIKQDKFKQGILICTGTTYGGGTLTHVISQPLSQTGDNLDYTIGIYNNQANCQTNGYTGLLDIEYVSFGECTAYNNYDLKITSCTANGLVGFQYSSQDFSCSGTATAITIAPANTCTSGNNNIVGLFQGYSNFVCAPGAKRV